VKQRRSRSQSAIDFKIQAQSGKSAASNNSSVSNVSNPSNTSGKSPGTSPTPRVRKAFVPGQARDNSRDFEIRKTVEDVLFDTFRGILDSVPVKEYASAVLSDALQTNPATGGLSIDDCK
jgi:hypothetical protein